MKSEAEPNGINDRSALYSFWGYGRNLPSMLIIYCQLLLTGMEVAGEKCQVVGNRFLLNIPDKAAVIVHTSLYKMIF